MKRAGLLLTGSAVVVLGLAGWVFLVRVVPRYAAPQWVHVLSKEGIVPSQGLGGVRVGDTPGRVEDLLGETEETFPERVAYRYGDRFLGVFFDPRRSHVRSFRLSDKRFNADGSCPSLKGVTIGSTEAEVLRNWGDPVGRDEHFTCPKELGEVRATTLRYPGIQACICAANGKVYWIDVP